jgi:hypothetical protein
MIGRKAKRPKQIIKTTEEEERSFNLPLNEELDWKEDVWSLQEDHY